MGSGQRQGQQLAILKGASGLPMRKIGWRRSTGPTGHTYPATRSPACKFIVFFFYLRHCGARMSPLSLEMSQSRFNGTQETLASYATLRPFRLEILVLRTTGTGVRGLLLSISMNPVDKTAFYLIKSCQIKEASPGDTKYGAKARINRTCETPPPFLCRPLSGISPDASGIR